LGTFVAQHRRNDVIHSVWRRPLMIDAFGWRSVPQNQRKQRGWFTKAYNPTRSELISLLDALVALIDKSDKLVQKAHVEKAQRLYRSWVAGESTSSP
jgi:hypothetical protein